MAEEVGHPGPEAQDPPRQPSFQVEEVSRQGSGCMDRGRTIGCPAAAEGKACADNEGRQAEEDEAHLPSCLFVCIYVRLMVGVR